MELHVLGNFLMGLPSPYVETDEDHLNDKKQRRFIQSSLQQGSQPPPLMFGRDSKAGRGVEKLYSEK